MRSFFAMVLCCLAGTVLGAVDAADIFCERNGGVVYGVTLGELKLGLCRFAHGEVCGHDGAYFILSECEKWDFFDGTCDKGNCAKILLSVDEKGEIMRECQPITRK